LAFGERKKRAGRYAAVTIKGLTLVIPGRGRTFAHANPESQNEGHLSDARVLEVMNMSGFRGRLPAATPLPGAPE
jgi:hypothetical protein